MFTGGGFIIVIIVINNRVSILALLKQTHELINDYSASEAREHKNLLRIKAFLKYKTGKRPDAMTTQ